MDESAIIREILKDYALPVRGYHGVVHWARVRANGLKIAHSVGANEDVVRLFALFHDSRRVGEKRDKGHGERGGELARSLRRKLFDLGDAEFDLLYSACCLHTDGLTDADPTLQVCWDADRLDLGRCGIAVRPDYLCTDAARAIMEWANERAVTGHVPKIVDNVWLRDPPPEG